jgi:hypothetical protein
MNFKKKIILFWVIFALLDPDPDSEYGSGSTDPIESGSDTVLDPQPWSQKTSAAEDPCNLRTRFFYFLVLDIL